MYVAERCITESVRKSEIGELGNRQTGLWVHFNFICAF